MTARTVALAAALALAACATGRSAQGDTTSARKALARELIRRGDTASAFGVVSGLFRDHPHDAEVLTLRGIVYRDQKLTLEAEADLREATELAPRDPLAHASLAVLLDEQGRTEEALKYHRRATELDPRDAGHLNNLGFSLLAHGRAKESIPVLREALRLAPADGRIRNNLGFAYARTGDFRAASEQFAMGGRPAEAKTNLGYAYQLANNLPQAFDLYQEALRLEPGLEPARSNLDEVARRLGRPVQPVSESPRS